MGQAKSNKRVPASSVNIKYHVLNGSIPPDRNRARIFLNSLDVRFLYEGRRIIYSPLELKENLMNLSGKNIIVLAVRDRFIIGAIKCLRTQSFGEIEYVQTSKMYSGVCTQLVEHATRALLSDGFKCVKIWMHSSYGPAACRCYLRALMRSSKNGKVYLQKDILSRKPRFEIIEIPKTQQSIRTVSNVLCTESYGYVNKDGFANAYLWLCIPGFDPIRNKLRRRSF